MENSKAYNSGYDFALSGGDGKFNNPFPPGSSSFNEWNQGFDDYYKQGENEALDDEYFSDFIEH